MRVGAVRVAQPQARASFSVSALAGVPPRGGGRRMARRPLPPYREWLKGEGLQYRYPPPGRGPHWLGETPFPLNPAFSPPPPIHQKVRDDMWRLHTSDPAQWTVRSLSNQFRVSLERTEAILRLKALEEEFKKEVRMTQLRAARCAPRMLHFFEKID